MLPFCRRIFFIAIALVLVFFITKLVCQNTEKPASAPAALVSEVQEKLQQTLASAKPERDDIFSLRAAIASSSKLEAVALIRDFLASGKDRDTGMEFEIETDGSLKSWPTLRTLLLDLVAAIDPVAAAEISREILAKPTTADEWAIALRNLGKSEPTPQTSAFLTEKAVELIRNPAWQAAPSVGYLNAFDVLVHTEATAATPLLSGLIQNKDRKDLAHASFLTLDRLVQRQPLEMLQRLAADTALHQSRPEMTAQQFARADLRDDAQRNIVKFWLLDPSRTASELRSFAAVYPNNNHFVSHNLLTSETPPQGADLAAHDRAALRIVKSWQDDPEFQPIRDHLSSMAARLEQFTKTATPPER